MNQMLFLNAFKIKVISKYPNMIMLVKGVIVPYAYKCLIPLDVLFTYWASVKKGSVIILVSVH